MTFTNDPAVVAPVATMMMASREAVVDYMTPLGLAHIMATGHHYGPGAVGRANATRADWTPVLLPPRRRRRASASTARASGQQRRRAVLRRRCASATRTATRSPTRSCSGSTTCGWDEQLRSGRTLWDELVYSYNAGVDSVRSMQKQWDTVDGKVDAERFAKVKESLGIQERRPSGGATRR